MKKILIAFVVFVIVTLGAIYTFAQTPLITEQPTQGLLRIKKYLTPHNPVLFHAGVAQNLWEDETFYFAFVEAGHDFKLFVNGSEIFINVPGGKVLELNLQNFIYPIDTVITPLPPVYDPVTIQAEYFSFTSGPLDGGGNAGVKRELNNTIVGFINVGDVIKYDAVDLSGKSKVILGYAMNILNPPTNRIAELRMDSETGALLATIPAEFTNSWTTATEREFSFNYTLPDGVIANIFLVIKGDPGGSTYWGNLDYLRFE